MPTRTKAELLAENERLQKRVTTLERAKARSAAASKEIRQLRADLLESEQQQMATAEILRIISNSPDDTQPVFDAIVHSAARLFGGINSTLRLIKGDRAELVASTSPVRAGEDDFPMPVADQSLPVSRTIARREVVQVSDALQAKGVSVQFKRRAEQRGFRSIMIAPLLRDNDVIGTINVNRAAAGLFKEKEVALLRTFADQAVIAIENVRLFNETREALEQQTATADILRVISRSPTDVQPVFDAVAESAARLCAAHDVVIRLVEGNEHCAVAHHGPIPVGSPNFLTRTNVVGHAILDARTMHIPDVTEAHAREQYPETRTNAGQRTVLAVPLLRKGKAVGVIGMRRLEVRPFTDKQIRLLETFAAQAVIAIENVRLFTETREALEQQTATADILRVISSSPTDVQPVFDAVAESAARLCAAYDVVIRLVEGNEHRAVAHHGPIPVNPPHVVTRANLGGRAIIDARTVHIPDVSEAHVREEYPETRASASGQRTFLAVPLLREGKAIGLIVMRRLEVRPFTDKQIQLLETFAAQAVIAIENVRLFNETKEALEQQTVISEILRVISHSPTDVQPVFDAIVNSAGHLFSGIHEVSLRLVHGDLIETVASTLHDTFGTNPAQLDDESMPAPRALRRRQVVQIPDILAAEEWVGARAKQRAGQRGWRSLLGAPLVRENNAIGAIVVTRVAPGPFTDKQIALLKTFADQAVIAIENVRLFNEIKEALEQQTAISDILRIISSSPTDTQPVFDAIVQSGAHLFDGAVVTLRLVQGELSMLVAGTHDIGTDIPYSLSDESIPGVRAIRRLEIAEVTDAFAPEWADTPLRQRAERRGFRAVLAAPMIRDDAAVGAINVLRTTPGPFSEKQVALLKTFADQAVIAIENVRLFNETKEALEQQTATADILRVISGSPTDVQPVFDAVAESAARLCGAHDVVIRLVDGNDHRAVAHHGPIPVLPPSVITRASLAGPAILDARTVHIPDVTEAHVRAEYPEMPGSATGQRTFLAVPLLREGKAIGLIVMRRLEVRPFTDKQIQLLETFAAQAVIAIENVRLFHEIADKGRQLEVASRHKSDFLASMSHELRTPLNAILGFIELILDQIYGEVPADLQEPLADIQASGKHLLRLINNVLDLAKIEAGRMELALAEYSVQDTVESVRQTLRPLAADKGLEFLVTVPPNLPFAHGDPGRITQCLMNLAGNSLKFTKTGKVEISVEQQGERLVFRVADTGIGIAPDKIDSLFTEFKQTDATIAGEYGGTGLGLSISRKFVEMHGGRIWVESELGRGSTFVFELPLRAVAEGPS